MNQILASVHWNWRYSAVLGEQMQMYSSVSGEFSQADLLNYKRKCNSD